MAARAAVQSLGGRLRSTKCFLSGQSIRPLFQEAEAGTRIYGAPKKQRLHTPLRPPSPRGYYDRYVSTVSESKRSSTPSYGLLQHLAANYLFAKPKPKPKPDIYVHHIDEDRSDYFTAYSLQEDGTLSRKYDIYPPAIVHDRGFALQYSCNGLFHFLNERQEHLLWNPTTNEFKLLPRPFEEPIPHGVTYEDASSGMWFDTRSGDYKVATLVIVVEEDEEDEYHGASLSYQVVLYSLKSNSWKIIPCLEVRSLRCIPGVCINGFYYSLATSQKSTPVILSFDFSAAALSSIPLPDDDVVKSGYREVIVYNGLLGLVVQSGIEFKRKYEVWVMNDGSWSREAVFDTSGVGRLEWFSENGELLYMTSYNHELLVYDRAAGELKPLGIYGLGLGSIHLIPFFENCVHLKGVSDVEDHEQKKEEFDQVKQYIHSQKKDRI